MENFRVQVHQKPKQLLSQNKPHESYNLNRNKASWRRFRRATKVETTKKFCQAEMSGGLDDSRSGLSPADIQQSELDVLSAIFGVRVLCIHTIIWGLRLSFLRRFLPLNASYFRSNRFFLTFLEFSFRSSVSTFVYRQLRRNRCFDAFFLTRVLN